MPRPHEGWQKACQTPLETQKVPVISQAWTIVTRGFWENGFHKVWLELQEESEPGNTAVSVLPACEPAAIQLKGMIHYHPS